MATHTPIEQPVRAGDLSPLAERFVLHWGEMGARWGLNRTCAQIQALLFLHARAFAADEIAESLGIARSNVSNSLRELTNWGLVRVVHRLDDRRDHFETSSDPWELLRIVVRERRAREFDPTTVALRALVADPDFERQDPATQARLRETLHLMDNLAQWTDDMLSLEPGMLMRLMRMGVRIQALLGRAKPRARRPGPARRAP